MKTKITLAVAAIFTFTMMACSDAGYKKTKSGLVYKLIRGSNNDSVAVLNDYVKFQFIRKINDSLIYSSYGKMPGFTQLNTDPTSAYSPLEVFFLMRKGDSAVVKENFDTLLKKGMTQQLPFGKKGDIITTNLKILEIFKSDSTAKADFDAEMLKDKPRQEKEMKEMQAKEAEKMKAEMKKEHDLLVKSGEIERANKEIEAYLTSKNISAQKAEGGTYVLVKQKGDGQPVTDNKYVTVRYTGKLLPSESVFESNVYMFQVGPGNAIQGWHDGLKLFNKGGTGTLFVPGYLAYGNRNDGPGGKAFQPLIFDVEIWGLSDTQEGAFEDKRKADSVLALRNSKAVKK